MSFQQRKPFTVLQRFSFAKMFHPRFVTFQVGCKVSLVFFQYCVMANFYWLLVEGLYLHILLMVIFSPNRHFTIYLLIGWGKKIQYMLLFSLCIPNCALFGGPCYPSKQQSCIMAYQGAVFAVLRGSKPENESHSWWVTFCLLIHNLGRALTWPTRNMGRQV